MEHLGAMHSHMAGMFKGKSKEGAYDFGWGNAWRWGFLIGSILFLAAGVGVQVLNSSLYLLSDILLLIALQLFLGDMVVRFIAKMDEELVLPYVDLLRSEKDVILDAGCGSGRTTIAVSKIMKNGRVVAVDRFDADYIDGGGKRLLERNLKIANIMDRVDIQAQDITALKFEDGTLDAAISSYMFDHLGTLKLQGLKEVNRVLKKESRFLLIVAVPNYMTFMLFSFLSGINLISVREWKRLFGESGFTCVTEGDVNGGHYFLLEKRS